MQRLVLSGTGAPRTGWLLLPERRAADSALLINLAGDARSALTQHPYSVAPLAFLAAGHAAVSLDLPGHGDWIDRFGTGLDGIAASLAAGVDAFAALRAHVRAAVDACLTRDLGRPGRIFISGTSRGGLAALHAMAEDDRIAAGALNAPVTHLPALREFAPHATTPLVVESSAMALVPRVMRRPVWIGINRDDPRVSTTDCRAFFAALRAARTAADTRVAEEPREVRDDQEIQDSPSVLDIYEGEGHRLPDEAYRRGADWLLEQVTQAATKGSRQA
jgi:poly(3-hydroxybutyrate) depolymerase